jgi:hypothetical protein
MLSATSNDEDLETSISLESYTEGLLVLTI